MHGHARAVRALDVDAVHEGVHEAEPASVGAPHAGAARRTASHQALAVVVDPDPDGLAGSIQSVTVTASPELKRTAFLAASWRASTTSAATSSGA